MSKQGKKSDKLNLRNFVNEILSDEELRFDDLYEYIVINILPDIYDSNKSNKDFHGESHAALDTLKSVTNDYGKYSYWENFVSASLRGNNSFLSGHDLRNDIKKNLYVNPQIVYHSANVEQCTVKENILNKMGILVDSIDFSVKNEMIQYYFDVKYLYHEKLVDVCVQLFNNGNKECLRYLFFLFVLVCIFQNDVKSLSILYNKSTINDILNGNRNMTPTMVEVLNNPAFVSLTDRKYCHKYFAYLYRPTYERKYLNATLEFVENEVGSLDATLELSDQIYDIKEQGKAKKKIFKGKPIYNKIDDIVYIVFTSSNGSLSVLFFKYDIFDSNDMEFRTGIFVSGYPKRQGPVVQKIVISKNKIIDTSIIDGILKMSNNMIVLSEDYLNDFIELNKNQIWFDDFKKNILPFILSHTKKYYVFSEDEIVSYTNSELENRIKIEIAKLLKAKSISDNTIDCKDYELLYRVIKNYSK